MDANNMVHYVRGSTIRCFVRFKAERYLLIELLGMMLLSHFCIAEDNHTPVRGFLQKQNFLHPKDERPLNLETKIVPYVSITPNRVSSGGTIQVTVGIHREVGAKDVVNPFLWEEYYLPAELILQSLDGRIRLNLLRQNSHMHNNQAPDLYVPSLWTEIGREFTFQIQCDVEPSLSIDGTTRRLTLPEGEYFLQSKYTWWVFASLNFNSNFNSNIGKPACPGYRAPRLMPNTQWEDGIFVDFFPDEQMSQVCMQSARVPLTVVDREQRPTVGPPENVDFPVRYTLTPDRLSGKLGDNVALHIVVSNNSSLTVDVPFWGSEGDLIHLVVSNRKQNEILGELWLPRSWVSPESVPRILWVRIPPGGFVKRVISTSLGRIYREPDKFLSRPTFVHPGEYNVQLLVHRRAIDQRPQYANQWVPPWKDEYGFNDDYEILEQIQQAHQRVLEQWAQWRLIPPGPVVYRSNTVIMVIR